MHPPSIMMEKTRFCIGIPESTCILQIQLGVRGNRSYDVEQNLVNFKGTQIPWESRENADSEAGGLGWSVGVCISNSLPGDAEAPDGRADFAGGRTPSLPKLIPFHPLRSRRPLLTLLPPLTGWRSSPPLSWGSIRKNQNYLCLACGPQRDAGRGRCSKTRQVGSSVAPSVILGAPCLREGLW